VVFINLKREFSYIKKSRPIVKLDPKDENIAINNLGEKIKLLKKTIAIRQDNLNSKSKIRQISKYELNGEKLALLNTKLSLTSTKLELALKKHLLQKKLFFLSNGYLGKIFVTNYQFVGPGGKVFEYYDFDKSKIEVYIPADEVANIQNKDIYINGKKTSKWKIDKISKVKDSQKISSYFVKLVKKNRKPSDAKFGNLVRIEFK
jgi:multidrug resistance efflux pump